MWMVLEVHAIAVMLVACRLSHGICVVACCAGKYKLMGARMDWSLQRLVLLHFGYDDTAVKFMDCFESKARARVRHEV